MLVAMSWFGKDLASLFSSDTECAVTDIECDEEVADGVVVERRSVLWLSAAAVASILTGSTALGAQDTRKQDTGKQGKRKQDKLSFQQFLEEVYPLAKKVTDAKGKSEEAYLMTVAAAMSRLSDPGVELRATMRKFVGQHRQDGARFPLAAMSMRLQAGRGFSHHDHRNYNGVIMGLTGEVRIRNFDILGDNPVPPDGKTFRIRQTCDDLILPGRFSTLGLHRDNVHELVAGPDGGRVLDVFTIFGGGSRSAYLDVEKKPRDAERRVYDAAWKPPRRRRRKR